MEAIEIKANRVCVIQSGVIIFMQEEESSNQAMEIAD